MRTFFKKLFCFWLHTTQICHPEVWNGGLGGTWHCRKCHPCTEGLDQILKEVEQE